MIPSNAIPNADKTFISLLPVCGNLLDLAGAELTDLSNGVLAFEDIVVALACARVK